MLKYLVPEGVADELMTGAGNGKINEGEAQPADSSA